MFLITLCNLIHEYCGSFLDDMVIYMLFYLHTILHTDRHSTCDSVLATCEMTTIVCQTIIYDTLFITENVIPSLPVQYSIHRWKM